MSQDEPADKDVDEEAAIEDEESEDDEEEDDEADDNEESYNPSKKQKGAKKDAVNQNGTNKDKKTAKAGGKRKQIVGTKRTSSQADAGNTSENDSSKKR